MSSCPCESSALVKEQVGTTIVAAFLTIIVTMSKYILIPHRAHPLVDVRPRLTANDPSTTGTATRIQMKHNGGVVSLASGHTVVVKHAVMGGILSRGPEGRRHNFT